MRSLMIGRVALVVLPSAAVERRALRRGRPSDDCHRRLLVLSMPSGRQLGVRCLARTRAFLGYLASKSRRCKKEVLGVAERSRRMSFRSGRTGLVGLQD